MYERIVVPLDGSKLAEAALPYAEELAAKMGSDIVLLTVLESGEPGEHLKHEAYTTKIAEITRYHAGEYLGDGRSNSINVVPVTRTGAPAQSILEYTDKGNTDLIIMASHGRSGMRRWAVGSVADKVVRGATRQPVLLIRASGSRPETREKRASKRALVPLDGSIASRSVVPYITRIASRLDMELTLLQVAPGGNGASADARAYLQAECAKLEADAGIYANYRVCTGSVADAFIDLADEFAFDLVAMSTHGRTGVSHWTLGSVAEKVFLGGNTPLLLVKQ